MSTSNSPAGAPSLPPGSFCWIELGTTDATAAKAFYGALFGWQSHDTPTGPGGMYSIFNLDGRAAAAGYTLQTEQLDLGVPPNWMLYIKTSNADATASKAAEWGGTVLMPAFDVMDAGRMAVLRDPTGAVFAVWQAKHHAGLGVIDSPGALCWVDLSTPDVGKAVAFYEKLFGWTVDDDKRDTSGYRHIKNGDRFIGGIPPAAHRQPGVPPHWLAYFQVADCKASAEKAKSLGANLLMPPMFMEGVGTISIIADPQGAAFALFEPATRK